MFSDWVTLKEDETEYHLQKTAYLVEQELRSLKGLKPLDSIEMIDILGE